MSSLLSSSQVKEFVLAGNAIVTVQSGKSGCHFTYKITKYKDVDTIFFVKLLYGQNNEQDYQYIGCYYSDTKHFHVGKPWKNMPVYSWPKSLRAINYLFNTIDNIPDNLLVYHEGKCGRCGRKLTTPDSIKRGFGPECYKETTYAK